METNQSHQAVGILGRSSQRLAMYLGEQEQECFLMFDRYESSPDSFGYSKQTGLDHLTMLKAFVVDMKVQMRRNMASVLGPDHALSILFRCYIGDALSVLGICLDMEGRVCRILHGKAELLGTNSSKCLSNESKFVWKIAGEYYRKALKKWTRNFGLDHPNIPSTACSLARCLREIGRRKEALIILSSVIGYSRKSASHVREDYTEQEYSDTASTLMFTPPELLDSKHHVRSRKKLSYDVSIAMCLWSMAVYCVEESPNEEGKLRSLNFLQIAALKIAKHLKNNVCIEDSEKLNCTDLLLTIENEAKRVFSLSIVNEPNKNTSRKDIDGEETRQSHPDPGTN